MFSEWKEGMVLRRLIQIPRGFQLHEHPGRRAQGSGYRNSRIVFISCLFPWRFATQGGGFLSTWIRRRRALLYRHPGRAAELTPGGRQYLPGFKKRIRSQSTAFLCSSCENLFLIPRRSILPHAGTSDPTNSRFGDGSHKKN